MITSRVSNIRECLVQKVLQLWGLW